MPHFNVNPVDWALFSNGFSIGPHHNKAWEAEKQRIHRLRGEVLSTVVEVESSVDYVIGSCLLPHATTRTPATTRKRHYLLQNEVLTRLEFHKKIEIMESLLSQRFRRKRPQISRLVSLLRNIRGVRNRMAHAPVCFEALQKPVSGRWLRPHLMATKEMIHVSDGYLRRFRENSLEAVRLLQELMRLGVRKTPK
jgi:hypothetical protein